MTACHQSHWRELSYGDYETFGYPYPIVNCEEYQNVAKAVELLLIKNQKC